MYNFRKMSPRHNLPMNAIKLCLKGIGHNKYGSWMKYTVLIILDLFKLDQIHFLWILWTIFQNILPTPFGGKLSKTKFWTYCNTNFCAFQIICMVFYWISVNDFWITIRNMNRKLKFIEALCRGTLIKREYIYYFSLVDPWACQMILIIPHTRYNIKLDGVGPVDNRPSTD